MQQCTFTHCSSILTVLTVVSAKGASVAVAQHALPPVAFHVIKPDLPCSFTKFSAVRNPNCCFMAQLPTCNNSILQIPVVITNSASFSVVEDLHTTLHCIASSNKSQVILLLCCRCNEE